jgi:signal transduction histidine kinase
MRQAALNIIANAIKFTEAGGQVIVSTTIAERGEVALRVRDTGIGMTTDEIEAALEPFREVSVSGPRKGGGTGLGLPLTKALVEANHGRFRITSRKDGGTLVEMVFSAARQARSA